ncbi:hypothetical protein [Xylocopilactobacillus apicola]|uniref:MarR family transcriptional regulator n=1 Tax=Xylocopilactobacillus apicola TaxID=2932184 RepID=A0AAU9DAA8_9LACO|nr:hypothetical protein [Xylocopilactobacillus apicola]BDR57767.1 hypothetical protein XA3_02080 [Xylocopilactobacillus apicola]
MLNKYAPPEIKTNVEKTILKIWKVDFLSTFQGEEINERERIILKSIISSPGNSLSHKQIETITELTRTQVTNSLNSLIQKGIIEKYGKSKSTRYGIFQTKEQILADYQALPELIRTALDQY